MPKITDLTTGHIYEQQRLWNMYGIGIGLTKPDTTRAPDLYHRRNRRLRVFDSQTPTPEYNDKRMQYIIDTAKRLDPQWSLKERFRSRDLYTNITTLTSWVNGQLNSITPDLPTRVAYYGNEVISIERHQNNLLHSLHEPARIMAGHSEFYIDGNQVSASEWYQNSTLKLKPDTVNSWCEQRRISHQDQVILKLMLE